MQRSAWKKNSPKFVVAISPPGWGLRASGWGRAGFLAPMGVMLVAFVAWIRSERLRLATSELPENIPGFLMYASRRWGDAYIRNCGIGSGLRGFSPAGLTTLTTGFYLSFFFFALPCPLWSVKGSSW